MCVCVCGIKYARYAVCIHSVSHIQFRLSVLGIIAECVRKERFAIASFISNKCMKHVVYALYQCNIMDCVFVCWDSHIFYNQYLVTVDQTDR